MKNKRCYVFVQGVLWGFGSAVLQAPNPICPPGLNIADPTARVWDDGRFYVHGSRDESLKYYCSYDHWAMTV